MRKKLLAVLVAAAIVALTVSPAYALPQEYDWTNIGQAGNDSIYALAYDSANNVLYAGTFGSGVWRCANPDGNSPTWEDITPGVWAGAQLDVRCLAFDGTVLFSGSDQGDGVWRCADPDAASPAWENMAGPIAAQKVTALTYFDGTDRLFAGTGTHHLWRCAHPGTAVVPCLWQDANPFGTLYWFNDLAYIEYGSSNDYVFAALAGGNGVRRWDYPNGAIPLTDVDTGGDVSGKTGMRLEYDSVGDNLYALTLSGDYQVWRCDGPGAAIPPALTWTDTGRPYEYEYIHDLAYDAGNNVLYTGGENAVWCCKNPDTSPTWSNTGGDFGGSDIKSLAVDDTNGFIYAGAIDGTVWRAQTSPQVSSLSASNGKVGDEVTIKGINFGRNMGSSYVSFGSTKVSAYTAWSASEITCEVPSGITGDVQVTVTTDAGTSNGKSFTVESPTTFYFAEGYTGTGFQEYLCLGNSSNTNATADVTFMFNDGSASQVESYAVPANSRYTIDVNRVVGDDKEVSLKVESESTALVAERPMYFDYQGKWAGGHDAVAATSPQAEWYFAEGTTRTGFEEYITVLNPGSTDANLEFHYMVEGEGETVKQGTVGANSRATFTAGGHVGADKDISLMLSSDEDVVAERPMYFDYQGLALNGWQGGHCVVGTNAPDGDWYFAEGTTRTGFEEWLCMQNPTGSAITVTATYMLGEGQGDPVEKTYQIPAKERLTRSVNQEIGSEKDVSVHLTCPDNFIAERPMYFNYQGTGNYGWDGGHDVLGTNAPARTWFFAEGYTGADFEEWLCIQNPTTEYATLGISYFPEYGDPVYTNHAIDAQSRLTINVNADAGVDLQISTRVESDKQVIVERPMYFKYAGVWPGGHDVIGFTP